MKKIIDTILVSLVVSFVTYFSITTFKSAKELESLNRAYYEAQTDIGDIIKRRFGSMISSLTFGRVKSGSSPKIDINAINAKRVLAQESNYKSSIYLAVVSAVALGLFFILNRYSFALMSSLVSLITLFFGVVTPILLIVIHKNISYLGDIVLSFESKTIVGTVSHLYSSDNYPVALTILLFSVVVPLLKSLSMLVVLLFKRFHIANVALKLFKHLGKWSMLDVFVVSLLLVFLSAGSSENSYSQIESGTYIFLIYVIFSIVTSIVVNGVLERK